MEVAQGGIELGWRETAKHWGWVAVMVGLCGLLAVLQYRWTGELSEAERQQMGAGLATQLELMARGFEEDLREATESLVPREEEGQDEAFRRWKGRTGKVPLFGRIAVAKPEKGAVGLEMLNQESGERMPMAWPVEWDTFRLAILRRVEDGRGPPRPERNSMLVEVPWFREGEEVGWYVFELDERYQRETYWPEMVRKYMVGPDYEVSVTTGEGGRTLYGEAMAGADATARVQREGRKKGGGGREGGGRWRISARHRAGSLDAAVRVTRWRNLTIAGLLLGLIAAAGWALERSTSKARRLAEMEFAFVAGVTHEFRTPLTVIRGAGHNLLSGVVKDAAQRERYTKLIVQHAENLTEMVEQVLGFAGARSGGAKNAHQAVRVLDAINEGLEAVGGEIEGARCEVDLQAPPEIPPVMGDPVALRRAFQNLIGNAAKHGGEGGWIGITVEVGGTGERQEVTVRVQDRGAGIPVEELGHVFEPFYRGERAKSDQVRGTGLGLSLVAEIAKAHGGSVTGENLAAGGAAFTLRLPAARLEEYDEFAHSAG